MVDFTEARETNIYTKKFAVFSAQPLGIEKVTKEVLEKMVLLVRRKNKFK